MLDLEYNQHKLATGFIVILEWRKDLYDRNLILRSAA